jgi:hypothetical protein
VVRFGVPAGRKASLDTKVNTFGGDGGLRGPIKLGPPRVRKARRGGGVAGLKPFNPNLMAWSPASRQYIVNAVSLLL